MSQIKIKFNVARGRDFSQEENVDIIQNAYLLFFEKNGKHIQHISIDFIADTYTRDNMRDKYFYSSQYSVIVKNWDFFVQSTKIW